MAAFATPPGFTPPPAGRVLILVPAANSPGKRDATGAFWPEAQAFARYRKADPAAVIRRFPVPAPMPERRREVLSAIRALTAPIDTLAFFCHGFKTGLQAGFTIEQAGLLARLLKQKMTPTAHVLLYACDAARDLDGDQADDLAAQGPGGDGGFADMLRDASEASGHHVTVMAHACRGHTTQNPYARRFAPGCKGQGGEWYVAPDSPVWKAWRSALRDPRSTLKFRFPTMSAAEIMRELSAPPSVA